MSFAARLPSVTVAVVPILSQPFRVSLRSLQWLNRRLPLRVPPAALQCRALHLYKTSRAKTVLGMHKVLPFEIYVPPPLSQSEHRINILDDARKQVIAKDITLQEAYEKYVEPGKALWMAETLPKTLRLDDVEKLQADKTADEINNYVVMKAYSTQAHVKIDPCKYTNDEKTEVLQYGPLKEVHILCISPVEYHRLMLDKAYRFIEGGCPVEFSIRARNAKVPKKVKLVPDSKDRWPWLHNHFPHLRPDFILKAMPKGTQYLIDPVSDGRTVQFALALPSKTSQMNLTQRLLKVRKAVIDSVQQGRQGELPMALRAGLIHAGNTNYTVESSRPRAALKPYRSGDDELRWGSDSLGALSEARREKLSGFKYTLPEDRYMETRKGHAESTGDERDARRAAQIGHILSQQLAPSDFGVEEVISEALDAKGRPKMKRRPAVQETRGPSSFAPKGKRGPSNSAPKGKRGPSNVAPQGEREPSHFRPWEGRGSQRRES
ncbi:hypothetical protein K458DRAFT_424881 [Lentithecium fluviatile CBS 122367]|uniref:Uncharacterized protein n=1 Tax=Lentithecium fluviatile CBS 122367 TaxID=1168545 RepID=A0A6G1IDR0_9PLEO|nr:hypothetical protein K458DRAFT_424881 [Lentithecium fluviatile CBS 122367]